MDKWVFATKNPHKLEEVRSITEGALRIESLPLEAPEAPEPYDTLYANALAKAAFYADWLGRPVVAEDSGLFVPALGGLPGVRSARFGGPQRLLELLGETPHRSAYFVAVVVAYYSPGAYQFFTGHCMGEIGQMLRGTTGFGYDPVFIPTGEEGTVAELGEGWKRRHSHRALAWRRFLEALQGG